MQHGLLPEEGNIAGMNRRYTSMRVPADSSLVARGWGDGGDRNEGKVTREK